MLVSRAGQQSAHQVRHHQADEADVAGQGHGAAGQADHQHPGQQPDQPDGLAQAAGQVITGDQYIELPGQDHGGGQGQQAEHQQGRSRGEVALPHRTGQPEQHAVQALLVDHQQRLAEGGEQGRQGGAGQHDAQRCQARLAPVAQGPDQAAGHRRAQQRAEYPAFGAGQAQQGDAQHQGKGGAGVDAEQPRRSQGIARHGLHQGAGHRQIGAHHQGDQQARQPGGVDQGCIQP